MTVTRVADTLALPRSEAIGADTHELTWAVRGMAYLRVLKPRETLLLSLIGIATAVLAGQGRFELGRFALVSLAIVVGSSGANGLTNYLDRHVDARMRRTQRRVLAQRLIEPPEKALAWAATLVAVALGLALWLHPYAFFGGLAAVAAAVIARKTWATHFLGAVSSCGPLWVGWFAMRPQVTPVLALLTALVMLWVPVHVWNLMLAYRADYLRAGVNIFPLDRSPRLAYWLCFFMALGLWGVSLTLWWAGGLGWLYLGVGNAASVLMVWACWRALRATSPAAAFRAFKLSAYPFLGLTFLALLAEALWH